MEDSSESSSAEQPVGNNFSALSSAEQPVSKKLRIRLPARDEHPVSKKRRIRSSEQPVSKKHRIRASAVDATTKVAFISCGVSVLMESQADRIKLKMMVSNLFDLGCSIFYHCFRANSKHEPGCRVPEVCACSGCADGCSQSHDRELPHSVDAVARFVLFNEAHRVHA